MQARSHALLGAAVWLAVAPRAGGTGGTGLDPTVLLLGAVVTGGAALLPDLDHPRATIARTLGPVTAVATRAVARLTGGHRGATHSMAAVALTWVGVTALLDGSFRRPAAAVIVFLCTALAIRAAGPQQARGGAALVALAAIPAAVVSVVGVAGPAAAGVALDWLPPAVTAGVLLHIAADLVTPGGVPLLWPLPGRHRLPLTRTGGRGEAVIALGALGVTLWLGAAQLLALA